MSSQSYLGSSKLLNNLSSNAIPPNEVWRGIAKRAFDIVMAFIGLFFLWPFFVYIAYLIKRDSPGPAYFWGSRMGQNGKPFKMLKFRTMYERPESYQGTLVTGQNDDRITPLGHWLRDMKINELPQLWNVLIGEMSFVGPRPEDPEIAKTWPQESFKEILAVRPGITSPASILYHDEEKLLSQANVMGDYFKSILPDKMRLDRLYVRHRSFFSDLDTIFWTLAILVPRWAGARIPEGYFFAGPFSRFFHRYFTWVVIDLLTALFGVGVAGLLSRSSAPLNWGLQPLAALAVVLAFLFSGVNYAMGSNRVVWTRAKAGDASMLLVSCAVVTIAILGLNRIPHLYDYLPYEQLPDPMIVMAGMLSLAGFIATRYRWRLLTNLARRWLSFRKDALLVGERVIMVGSGDGAQIASWLLRRRMFRTAFSIVGMVDNNNPTQYGMKVDGCWMLGAVNDLPSLIKRYDIGVILSTLPHNTPEVEYIFDLCHASNVRLLLVSDLMWMVDRQVTQPLGDVDGPLWLDERLEFKAMHDALTELPNRYLLQDRLRHSLIYAKRYKTFPAVMFIALDGIEKITETFGRRLGDHVLAEVAARLLTCKRESDTLARFGQSEFALLLENVTNERETTIIAKRISAAMAEPFDMNGHKFVINPLMSISLTFDVQEETRILRNLEIETYYNR
ncbi:MAG: diguanylate cyclase, partial [Chloroflexi bacterium]